MKIATGLLLCTFAGGAMAAEIRVLSAGAVEPGLRAAAAAFEKQTGNDVNITFNTAPEIRKRIGGGEAFDVVIAPPATLDGWPGAGTLGEQPGTLRAPAATYSPRRGAVYRQRGA